MHAFMYVCVCVCAPLTGLASKRATASSQYCPCCPVCSHVFIDQKQLRQHRMKEHRDLEESKWPCTLCTARFQSSSRLNSHVRSQHMHLKPFSCQMCGKAFSDGSNLRTHMALHRGEFCFCTYYSVFHRHFFFLIFLKLYIDTSKNFMLRNWFYFFLWSRVFWIISCTSKLIDHLPMHMELKYFILFIDEEVKSKSFVYNVSG